MNFGYKDAHHCEAAVITCVDFRFQDIYRKGITEVFGITDYDLWAFPGAAKNFVSPAEQEFAAAMIAKIQAVSVGLHNIKQLVILSHEDCGGYGGRKSFQSCEVEYNKHAEDLQAAKEMLQEHFPGITVRIGLARLAEDESEAGVVEIG
jgi:carbonic anhydrase